MDRACFKIPNKINFYDEVGSWTSKKENAVTFEKADENEKSQLDM